SNKDLTGVQTARIQELITGKPAQVEASAVAEVAPEIPVHSEHSDTPGKADAIADLSSITLVSAPTSPEDTDSETESHLVAYFTEHGSEIAAEGDKPFQPIGGIHDEFHEAVEAKAAAASATASPVLAPVAPPPANPA